MSFKPGDKVTCVISGGAANPVVAGKIYKIVEFFGSGFSYPKDMVRVENLPSLFYAERFVFCEPSVPDDPDFF